MYLNLQIAHKENLVSEKTIDESVKRLMLCRMKLGMFDSQEKVPFSNTPYEITGCNEHKEFAVEVAKNTMVLLKNENNLLPLDRNKIKTIAVIGPNADSREALIGNYLGTGLQKLFL